MRFECSTFFVYMPETTIFQKPNILHSAQKSWRGRSIAADLNVCTEGRVSLKTSVNVRLGTRVPGVRIVSHTDYGIVSLTF